MNILKTKTFFTYVVVGALVIALSVSCKSNEEPTDNTHSNHPPSGIYSGTLSGISGNIQVTVTSEGGVCNIRGTAYASNDLQYDASDSMEYDITITKWAGNNGGSVTINDGGSAGEATINKPNGVNVLDIFYNADYGNISLYFRINDKYYWGANNFKRNQ